MNTYTEDKYTFFSTGVGGMCAKKPCCLSVIQFGVKLNNWEAAELLLNSLFLVIVVYV